MKAEDITISWAITAYQKPEQLIHIIERIAGPKDRVWVHYDKKSNAQDIQRVMDHFRDDRRVVVDTDYKVYWGGSEIIEVDKLLAARILRHWQETNYVINFTGATYPIKSDTYLREYLAANFGKSFIDLFPDEPISDITSANPRFFAKSHFGVMPCRNWPKYTGLKLAKYKFNLYKLRLLKKLGIIKTKSQLPDAFPHIYRGSVHNVIYYPHYKKIMNDHRTALFFKQLKYAFAPDEVLFNTLLKNIISDRELVTNNNLTLTCWEAGRPSPKDLDYSDMDTIIKSDKCFARKFEDIEVLETIDLMTKNGVIK